MLMLFYLMLMFLLLKIHSQRIQITYSEDQEQKMLQYYFRGVQDKFYVDIGAFHPVSLSNTLKLYTQKWKGLNIEPNFDKFKIFTQMRKQQMNLNIGISTNDSFSQFYMGVDPVISTMSPEVKKSLSGRLPHVVMIPSFKLSTLCERYFIEKPWLMNLDAEGLGYKILSGNHWNIDKCRPSMILSEDNDLNAQSGDPLPEHILQANNYTLLQRKIGKNQVFIENSKVQLFKELYQKNQLLMASTTFVSKKNIQSKLKKLVKFSVLGNQYGSYYDPAKSNVFLKFARKGEVINIMELFAESNSTHINKDENIEGNRPIFIFEFNPLSNPIYIKDATYTLKKLRKDDNFKIINLSITTANKQSFQVYIFDHQYESDPSINFLQSKISDNQTTSNNYEQVLIDNSEAEKQEQDADEKDQERSFQELRCVSQKTQPFSIQEQLGQMRRQFIGFIIFLVILNMIVCWKIRSKQEKTFEKVQANPTLDELQEEESLK